MRQDRSARLHLARFVRYAAGVALALAATGAAGRASLWTETARVTAEGGIPEIRFRMINNHVLIPVSVNGSEPLELPNGETRKFLADGDTVVMTGWCEGGGIRVGFGEVSGTLLPAHGG
jgi:hypothetical protein